MERIITTAPYQSPARKTAGLEKEPLQVRIPVRVKRKFKAHAALLGVEPNELFVEVWNHYERTAGAALKDSVE